MANAKNEMEDFVIFDSSLTLDQLKEMGSYMDDDSAKTFSKEELDELAENINDAIHSVIEDFLNHREED
jgi:hypothetical protein